MRWKEVPLFFFCCFEKDSVYSGQDISRAHPKETQGKDRHLGIVTAKRADGQEGRNLHEATAECGADQKGG